MWLLTTSEWGFKAITLIRSEQKYFDLETYDQCETLPIDLFIAFSLPLPSWFPKLPKLLFPTMNMSVAKTSPALIGCKPSIHFNSLVAAPRHCVLLYWFMLCENTSRELKQTATTKGLISKTIDVHVRDKSLYISLPSSGKLERKMTKLCVVYWSWTTTANFSCFHLELNAVVRH